MNDFADVYREELLEKQIYLPRIDEINTKKGVDVAFNAAVRLCNAGVLADDDAWEILGLYAACGVEDPAFKHALAKVPMEGRVPEHLKPLLGKSYAV